VLLSLSFPKFGHPAFSWIALTPLLVALYGQPLSRSFGLGFVTGIVYFAGTLYWIARVLVLYGDLPSPGAALVNAALVAYLALYPALFAMLLGRLTRVHGARGLLATPVVWVASELGRAHLFTGFPWVLLGYSQAAVLPVAQLSSVVGVFGLSGLVAGVNAAMAFAAVAGGTPRGASGRGDLPRRFVPLGAAVALVAAIAGWGSLRIGSGALLRAGEPIRVGVLQGNVREEDRWQAARAAEVFRGYLAMTRQAVAQGAGFVVWPEGATPYPLGEDIAATAQVHALARSLKVPLLIGSDQIVHGQPVRYYNAAFLVRADGTDGGVYRKMHLVPFGEYVPARRLFFFASKIVQAASDFSAGDAATVLPVGGHRVSTAICYEIVYPDLVRQFTLAGSELLTTITNDSWFGTTSAPYQHFAQASMRAIENGRFLVRAANTGVSGIVDPYGRVTASTGLYVPAVVVGDVRFLHGLTVYARTGDVFAYACVVLTAALLVMARSSGRITRTPPRDSEGGAQDRT
jgi:apolipoprotein N-acyltransferase